jgi:hypothetical protein
MADGFDDQDYEDFEALIAALRAENVRLTRELNDAREVLAEYDKLVDALRAENATLKGAAIGA